ncbi:MAG TPA: tRNA-uridine aminocarboxypropyltransferase [Polyangiales bacterium]
MSEIVARSVCYRCHKPQVMCVCARVPFVDNLTQVLVLQHPRERRHPIGTARLARLGLRNVRVEVAWNAGVREEQAPAWVPEGAALLYPAPGARELAELPVAERPKHLLVIDGTWHTARTLYRDKAWLQRLPHYRFSPQAPSRYRLRREPQRDYVSTIEAIVEALRMLEPQTQGLDALLGAFDAMIDAQVEHVGRQEGVRRLRRRRPRAELRTPRALVTAFDRLVVLYVESLRPTADQPRELVQLTALALASGEEFERLLVPASGLPNALLLGHMQLAAGDFERPCDLPTLGRELQAFLAQCGPEPLLAAWNQSTLELVQPLLAAPSVGLSLKSAYRAVYGADASGLDAVIAKLGLSPVLGGFRGRAAVRLASAVVVARHLHARTQRVESATSHLPAADVS